MGAVTYDDSFFDMELSESMPAAEAMVPWILNYTGAKTVIDVGCGMGAWAKVARDQGCEVCGVDGAPISERVLIPECFLQADLLEGFDCSGWDLAICMEVGEHLPLSSASALVSGLCGARFVLFSAAVPGQGGIGHLNEQWQSWWSDLFHAAGYSGTEDVRSFFWQARDIAPYYRQNVILYARPKDLVAHGFAPSTVCSVVHPEVFDR